MIDKLLSHLYSALDKSPELRHVALVSGEPHVREVRRGVLRVRRAVGSELGRMDLGGASLGNVLDFLRSLGLQVVELEPASLGLSALALPEGEQGSDEAGGAYLSIPTSALWTLLRSIGVELQDAADAVDEARAQLYLRTASGEWLDYWGAFFGLPREGRGDDDYRTYLIVETLRPRSNPRAVEAAVRDATGWEVSLYEPVFDLFRLSRSEVSVARLRDADLWSHGVIVPTAAHGVDWRRVLPVIERNRPAGVVIRGPLSLLPAFLADAGVPADAARWSAALVSGFRVFLPGDPRLGEYILSVDEWLRNHRFGWYEARAHLGRLPADPLAALYGPRTVDMASVVMSDGVALGDPSAVFGRGAVIAGDAWKLLLSQSPGIGSAVTDLAVQRFDRVGAVWVPVSLGERLSPDARVGSSRLDARSVDGYRRELWRTVLSDGEVLRNQRLLGELWTVKSGALVEQPLDFWGARGLDRASVAMSDGAPLGEPEVALGRGRLEGEGPLFVRLSSSRVGGTQRGDHVRRLELLTLDARSLSAEAGFDAGMVWAGGADEMPILVSGVDHEVRRATEGWWADDLDFGVDLQGARWGDAAWGAESWAGARSRFGVRTEQA